VFASGKSFQPWRCLVTMVWQLTGITTLAYLSRAPEANKKEEAKGFTLFSRRHDIQHNDIQHNDTQRNNIQHNIK